MTCLYMRRDRSALNCISNDCDCDDLIFLWGIFRLKRKWFWQKRRSRKRVGSSNEISFDLHLISLSSGDCPLSEPWDLGKGMLAADSVCAEMTPKLTTEKETEWIRSEFPSWIYLIFHLYLSKSPCTGGGLPTPIPCEALSATLYLLTPA